VMVEADTVTEYSYTGKRHAPIAASFEVGGESALGERTIVETEHAHAPALWARVRGLPEATSGRVVVGLGLFESFGKPSDPFPKGQERVRALSPESRSCQMGAYAH
jgi:hypothetical protein